MIRKPAAGWGRESAAITAARTVAATSTTAVKTGGRVARGAWLSLFGAMWIFGGLGSLATGSVPGFVGGLVVGLLFMRAGKLAFRPKAETEHALTGAVGSTAAVDYSRPKLLGAAALAAVVLALSFAGAQHLNGGARLASVVMIPFLSVVVFACVRKAFGDLAALRWNRDGLTVTGLLKRRTVPWSVVQSIEIERINTYAAYGLIKTWTGEALVVRLMKGGLFGGKLSVTPGLLSLAGETVAELALRLQAAYLGRQAGRPSPHSAPAPQPYFTPPPAASPAPVMQAPPPRRPIPAFSSVAPGDLALPYAGPPNTFGNEVPFGRRGLH